jgi:hypothetical protein
MAVKIETGIKLARTNANASRYLIDIGFPSMFLI